MALESPKRMNRVAIKQVASWNDGAGARRAARWFRKSVRDSAGTEVQRCWQAEERKKWERREAGSASKFEKWREVSQARGFAVGRKGGRPLGRIVEVHDC